MYSEMTEREYKSLGDIALWSNLFDMGNCGPRPPEFPQPDTKEHLPTRVFSPTAELIANSKDYCRGSAKLIAFDSCLLDNRHVLRCWLMSFQAKLKFKV